MKYTFCASPSRKVKLKQKLTIKDLTLDKGTIVEITKVGDKIKVVSPTGDSITVKKLDYEP